MRRVSMSMPARLETHLAKHHVAYGKVFHPAIHGAQRTASVMHYPGKEVAKTIALRAGHKTLLAVLPASHHINLERLGAVVGGKVHILSDRRCAELFPDCEVGAVPPFGGLYGLPVYMDQTLVENPEIVFCAGNLSEGIRMGNVEFMHLVNPRVGEFAEKS
jgi:Ala-tRNA(Pro) deacylase